MRPDNRQRKHPCRPSVLSWITDVNEKVNLCGLAVTLYVSCPLKMLKETVVFYYALCNLLAFKDDFPSLFLAPRLSHLLCPEEDQPLWQETHSRKGLKEAFLPEAASWGCLVYWAKPQVSLLP